MGSIGACRLVTASGPAAVAAALLVVTPPRSTGEGDRGEGAAIGASSEERRVVDPRPPAPLPLPAAPAGAYPAARATLGFVGDLALALHVRHYLERQARGVPVPEGVGPGYPFDHVSGRLVAADLLAGNLECVVSSSLGPARERAPLVAPESAVARLRLAGFDVLGVANNHTHDLGPGAARRTVRALRAAGIAVAGADSVDLAERGWVVREAAGLRVAYVGYHRSPEARLRAAIAGARGAAELVVVLAHWGNEGCAEPLPVQRSLARVMIDAGADFVVGAHAHVLQPEEWYRGKLVVYGLGNFVFSGMGWDERLRTGGYLEVDVDRSGVVARRLHLIDLDSQGAPRWRGAQPAEPGPLAASRGAPCVAVPTRRAPARPRDAAPVAAAAVARYAAPPGRSATEE